MKYLLLILAAAFVLNFVVMCARRNKNKNFAKKLTDDRIAAERKLNEIIARLDSEQEQAKRLVNLRNRTFELYDEVRQRGDSINNSDNSDPD